MEDNYGIQTVVEDKIGNHSRKGSRNIINNTQNEPRHHR
jgi:hypothetical protein